MARADSSVRVNVTGDTKGLSRAMGQAEGQVAGFGKSLLKLGGVIAGAAVVGEVTDFAQSAISEFDRVGDATLRLNEQLGELAGPLQDTAGDFHALGASRQDILELEARIADLGTAAGIADPLLAATADDVAATASAMALLSNTDAATIVDQIGKASGGAARPLKELGISLSDAEVEARALADTGKTTADSLTDGELAAARMQLILEKLAPRLAAVTGAEVDLEAKQAELQARFETLTGRIGEHLEGPLNDFLAWILAGLDGLERMDEFVDLVGDSIDRFVADVREALGPLASLLDMIGQAIGAFQTLQRLGIGGGGVSVGAEFFQTLNVQGGSPEAIEQAVRNALNTINNR